MTDITIERMGGLAGYGTAGSHLVSIGKCDLSMLPDNAQQSIKALFSSKRKEAKQISRDQFSYRITLKLADGKSQVVVVDEAVVPTSLVQTITDQIK